MSIPKYNELYLQVLEALSDGESHSKHEIADFIAPVFGITPSDRQQTLPSGGSLVYSDRVGWACTYLKKANLIESTKRAHYRLTQGGKQVLSNPPAVFDNRFLCQFPSFREFYRRKATQTNGPSSQVSLETLETNETPNDRIEQAYSELNDKLAEELLAEIMAKDSDFFEELVVKLLLKMGYGGSASDSGFRTQRTNDGGIDGVIREDKLGFDQIYIQAKRWDPETSISRPEIQKFSGALQEVKASKGLFITTAKFSEGAKTSAERQRIVLVDGTRLIKLMVEYNVGVSTIAKYEIKAIDSDFFNNEKA